MALRETVVKETGHNGLQFNEHEVAHRLLDNLHGLELGPSSHNSFGLEGSRSVAPADDFNFYKDGQVFQNGKYIETDIVGEADDIPVEDDSQDYILSSHVFEHIPNPFAAFEEWERVLKNGGYVFMIVPQRNALPSDAGRELSTFDELLEAARKNYRPETVPPDRTIAAGGPRGHYWVYSAESLKAIIAEWSARPLDQIQWEFFYEEDPDKKVGNGFCLVYRIIKPKPIMLDTAGNGIREEWTTSAGDEVKTPFLSIPDQTALNEEYAQKIASAMGIPKEIIDPPPVVKTPRKPKSKTL